MTDCKSCKRQLTKVETTYDFGKSYSKGLMCRNKNCKQYHKKLAETEVANQ